MGRGWQQSLGGGGRGAVGLGHQETVGGSAPLEAGGCQGQDHQRIEVQALAHAPLAHQSSLTKHKLKGKMADNLKTATREQ